MAEKEERILIARSTDYTISDTKDGALFDGKIAPHCANVFTRQEAIDKMANGIDKICRDEEGDPVSNSLLEIAEAALNALLEKE